MHIQEPSSFFRDNHSSLLEKIKHFQELHEIHQHFYDYGNEESSYNYKKYNQYHHQNFRN